MTERIDASRKDPRTLVPAARAMYAAGKTRSEVLTAIYGVDLPREAVLIERDYVAGKNKPIRAMWKTHPWELMIPLERGGPQFMLGSLEYDSEEGRGTVATGTLPLRLEGRPVGAAAAG